MKTAIFLIFTLSMLARVKLDSYQKKLEGKIN